MASVPLRVLVALDARPESLHALERTATLAAELGAEIAGLFVEDENLLRLCGLPVMEVRLHGGQTRHPEAAVLRRELRARASKARLALEREALRRRLAWSFRITHDPVEEEVLRAGPGTHLVTPSRAVRRGAARRRPTVGVVIGTDDDDRPLELAGRIAQGSEMPLLVLTPESALADPAGLRQRIESVIGTKTPATVASFGPGGDAVAERVHGLALEVLVARARAFTATALRRLSAAADCELVLLGDPAPDA